MKGNKVEAMSTKEIKAELDKRDITWRGVCFERQDLVNALARAQEELSEAAASKANAEVVSKDLDEDPKRTIFNEQEAYQQAYDGAVARAKKLKVAEIRAELAARSISWAGLIEKSELAATLAAAYARTALFSRSGMLEPGCTASLTAEQLRLELQDGRTPLLLDVYATWCGPCKLIAPQLVDIAKALGPQARIAKLDSDAEPNLSTELQVQGLPTLIFFRPGPDGSLNEVHRVEGVPGTKDALQSLVQQHLGVSCS
eukprot:CAMPEP_0119322554 /NCGR_PEP_ID=MMETSP1333-20130426/58567_1 /TAXON_ID=418940 /ORGANISM="Scyphosphaera apsteinii, Strain RCC1455" /LENGTH=256 /DNA_ID=CAMNT_0007329815 /DNA_START=172 /DNA_END=942 /DNA_ORIENTATION=+